MSFFDLTMAVQVDAPHCLMTAPVRAENFVKRCKTQAQHTTKTNNNEELVPSPTNLRKTRRRRRRKSAKAKLEQAEPEPAPSPLPSPTSDTSAATKATDKRPPLTRTASGCDVMHSHQVEEGFLFKFIVNYIIPFAQWYFHISLHGLENIPSRDSDESVMYITHHTTHTVDVGLGSFLVYLYNGKVVRGLAHRITTTLLPQFRMMGFVPGYREVAVSLIKSGESVAVIPGGVQEGMHGHENAYNLYWKSSSGKLRQGFAQVALDANVKVVPLGGTNTEEMMFCPMAWLWNLLGFSRMYKASFCSLPGKYGKFFLTLAMYISILVHMFSIPLPIRVKYVAGKPITPKPGMTAEAFSALCHEELQKLVHELNPKKRTDYLGAIRTRFFPS